MQKTQLLVLTGPESSGKSTLATQLCDSLRAPLVTEIAREYLSEKALADDSFVYQFDDLSTIARQQYEQENLLVSFQPDLIVCDTDLLVLMIWSELKYAQCDPWITETFERSITSKNPRHYFLCDWNIPWQQDPLRENPDNRDELFSLYLQKIKDYQLDYTLITGNQQQRLRQALDKHKSLY